MIKTLIDLLFDRPTTDEVDDEIDQFLAELENEFDAVWQQGEMWHFAAQNATNEWQYEYATNREQACLWHIEIIEREAELALS